MTERIITSLTLRETRGLDRTSDPLVWGVPLAQGVVREVNRLWLRDAASRRRLRMQAEASARWPDGSVKWALLTLPAVTLASVTRRRLVLSVAAGPALAPGMVKVDERDDGVHIDTGRLRLTIARQGALIPCVESRVGRSWHVRAEAVDLVTAVEDVGPVRVARSVADSSRAPTARVVEALASRDVDRTITVESRGPLRTVVAVRGTHVAESGEKLCRYTLRIDAIAGLARLRLTHSIVFDFDTDTRFLRASEVVLRGCVGGHERLAFGGQGGESHAFPRRRADWAADYALAELHQDSRTHYRVDRRVEADRGAVFGGEGIWSDGWAELRGDDGAVGASVREFWQNHPKAMTIDAASRTLRIGLYPRCAGPLNLRRYSGVAYMMTYEAPCTWKPETVPADASTSARGIRKTHDLCLTFDEPNPSRAAAAEESPLRLEWSPAYFARTRVIVPVAPRPHRPWQALATRLVDVLWRQLYEGGSSGYLDYFDLPMGNDPNTGRPMFDFGGLGYINDEAMPCLGLWQAFLATGDERALTLARAMGRHNGDIDSYHMGPHAGIGSRHNVTHWGDMCKDIRISQPIGKRWAYYLMGDRSVLDLVSVMLATFARKWATPRGASMSADVPAMIATLIVAGEAGLADTDAWLRSFADAVAASITPDGLLPNALTVDAARGVVTPGRLGERGEFGQWKGMMPVDMNMLSCFGGAQILAELAERFDHQPLRDGLVRIARHMVKPLARRQRIEHRLLGADHETRARWLDLFGYAYGLTGDRALVAAATAHLETPMVDVTTQVVERYGQPYETRRRLKNHIPRRPTPQQRASWARYYPLFGPGGTGEVFRAAVYLHKLQGAMLLSGAGPRQPRPKNPRRKRRG